MISQIANDRDGNQIEVSTVNGSLYIGVYDVTTQRWTSMEFCAQQASVVADAIETATNRQSPEKNIGRCCELLWDIRDADGDTVVNRQAIGEIRSYSAVFGYCVHFDSMAYFVSPEKISVLS